MTTEFKNQIGYRTREQYGEPITYLAAANLLLSGDERSVAACWFDENGETPFGYSITIYGPRKSYVPGYLTELCNVNWGALGSSNPEAATRYAEILLAAAKLAQAVNDECADKLVDYDRQRELYHELQAQKASEHEDGLHHQSDSYCPECNRIIQAAQAQERAQQEATAKVFNSRVKKIYKLAEDHSESNQTTQGWEQARAARSAVLCRRSVNRRRHYGYDLHDMNHEGSCRTCGKNMEQIEGEFAAAMATPAQVG